MKNMNSLLESLKIYSGLHEKMLEMVKKSLKED